MPLFPGIFASAISGHLTPADAGAYFPLGEFTLASAQSSIEFTNIPQTYKHLQIRILSRDNRATNENSVFYKLNSDTNANYSYHSLAGDGASASSFAVTSNTKTYGMIETSANATSNIFTAGIIDILDYSSTVKNKTIRTFQGYDSNGGGHIRLTSGLWFKTPEAITSISIYPDGSASFVANSSFALYGVSA